jgi:hypothetical protein
LGAVEEGSNAEGLERIAQSFYTSLVHSARQLRSSSTTPPLQCRTQSPREHTVGRGTLGSSPDSSECTAGTDRSSAGNSGTGDRPSMDVAEWVAVWSGLAVADVAGVPYKARCLPDSADQSPPRNSRQPRLCPAGKTVDSRSRMRRWAVGAEYQSE